ncbi:MAG: PQQ-dependent sugar dehydrogenase [Dehalococcoidia bacterium]|nr:PQQ-dependent sugar dehydrogenase [Dehalococcoidia bacterium]
MGGFWGFGRAHSIGDHGQRGVPGARQAVNAGARIRPATGGWPRPFLVVLLLAATACALSSRPPAEPRIEMVAAGLNVPWALAFSADGRLYFTQEVSGQLRMMVPEGGRLRLRPEPVLTVPAPEGASSTLRGLALDPEFGENGLLYTVCTYAGDGGRLYGRLARFTVRNEVAGEERVLLDGLPMAVTNLGGRVKFGPDGRFYLSTGYTNDFDLPQNPAALAGKILRLNRDGALPADNPDPASPVYSLGHRNVQGVAWQPGTSRLFATEHGPTGERGACCNDEVNAITRGGNYGWPVVWGAATDARFTPPVLTSGQDTWAPAGADFYRGPATAWRGSLFFASLRGQALHRVWFTSQGSTRVAGRQSFLAGTYGRLRDVVSGPDGCLYVATSNRDGRSGAQAGPEDDRILRVCPP